MGMFKVNKARLTYLINIVPSYIYVFIMCMCALRLRYLLYSMCSCLNTI